MAVAQVDMLPVLTRSKGQGLRGRGPPWSHQIRRGGSLRRHHSLVMRGGRRGWRIGGDLSSEDGGDRGSREGMSCGGKRRRDERGTKGGNRCGR